MKKITALLIIAVAATTIAFSLNRDNGRNNPLCDCIDCKCGPSCDCGKE